MMDSAVYFFWCFKLIEYASGFQYAAYSHIIDGLRTVAQYAGTDVEQTASVRHVCCDFLLSSELSGNLNWKKKNLQWN